MVESRSIIHKLQLVLLVLCLGIVLPAYQVYGQGKITGRLTDHNSKEILPAATVALLHVKDSTVAAIAMGDNQGRFEISGLEDGNYLLYLSFMGYKSVYKPLIIDKDKRLIDLGDIAMLRKGVDLKTVEIQDERPPIVVKKDTVEYNAGSFKTRPNAVVEDLLKRLPGVAVDRAGTITAHGQIVSRVLVNGKPFFGNDPQAATKNLPTEIVDKVQVIDKKSDEAEFTKVDDGKREKVINIVVKKNRLKGMFGSLSGGYGTNDRFSANMNLNLWYQTLQVSVQGGGNNVNGRGQEGGTGSFAIFSPGGSGANRTCLGGFNINGEINKKMRLNVSYTGNDTRNEMSQQSVKQTFMEDSSILNNSGSQTLAHNVSQGLTARLDYDMSASSKLMLESIYSSTSNSNYSISGYNTLNAHKDTINAGNTLNNGDGHTKNLQTRLTYMYRFKKPGRSLAATLMLVNTNGDQLNFNKSTTRFFNSSTPTTTIFNQQYDISNKNNSVGGYINYSEPIFKDHYLQASYTITSTHGSNARYAYDYDHAKQVYNTLNDTLSNILGSNTVNQNASLSFRAQKTKYDYSVGMGVVANDLKNNIYSFKTHQDSIVQQRAINISPTANFNYSPAPGTRLMLSYSGMSQQPTAQQLQPVPDHSNPLYIQLGNPDLKPSFTSMIGGQYTRFNAEKGSNLFVTLNSTFSSNKIIAATRLDSGVQVSRPENVNGAYSVLASVNTSVPLIPFSLTQLPKKTINLNSTTSMNFVRDVNYINGTLNHSSNMQLSQNIGINYVALDGLDLALSGNVSYNTTRYSLPLTPATNYFDYAVIVDGKFRLPKGVIIASDVTCNMSRGRAAGYNLTSTLWNASIAKTLLSKEQGLVKLQCFDILRQYVSVMRTAHSTYIEDVRTNTLKQYFMISFTYFLRRFPTAQQAPAVASPAGAVIINM
ncbi:outer membrane beta-barrel protein [Chitinophaga vietnamensis]|uniref:outer membrane beta-barrel protein n=1 Tax=Chitinophaga vietnamensis TaxID=2593957 RepID=UPI001177FF23|nr:outer membrane beta-barrel protein [Chitinophaga vietnamensis]